jgi:SAM-dependent methyltransferase
VFDGCERFFRPGYNANFVASWLPACDGVVSRLSTGANVADIGGGHGSSTVIMARAFPESRIRGFDYHDASIKTAEKRAADQGVADRVVFEVATAKNLPGMNYNLVTSFDCLHDMGDRVGAAAHVRQTLAPDGTWMIVEPYAGNRVEDNFNPVGRMYYSSVPGGWTGPGRPGGRGRDPGGGDRRWVHPVPADRRDPFNLIYEARP